MKIYFAGSIRGGKEYSEIYKAVISFLINCGYEVLSEHVGDKNYIETLDDPSIHDRDLAWIDKCNVVLADVSQPSGGVGYEIRYAKFEAKKPVYIFSHDNIERVSAMFSKVDGSFKYHDLDDYLLIVNGLLTLIKEEIIK